MSAEKGSRAGAAIAPARLSRGRYALFLAVTLLTPFILLGVAELALRLTRPDGGLPLFVPAQFVRGDYLVANQRVGARWFAGIEHPPAPAPEMFAAVKPAHAFRVFVLGESAAAGFPYPRNVMFSRYLRDVLHDVLPGDSVEVINLGIAATNSFAMLDIAREVAGQHPDAVLIYAGHNEFYGALGAASRVSVPGGTLAIRAYMRLLRLRTVMALRDFISSLHRRETKSDNSVEAASLMEVLARDRQIALESPVYRRGSRQFETNLESIARVFGSSGTPVFIASVASNQRDQPPFAAAENRGPGGADTAFARARVILANGDTVTARQLFTRARDLDVVRFRAPSDFNAIIRRVSARTGAHYVPVDEAFDSASPAGIPGSNLFLEHVHPTREGQALIGRVFLKTMIASGVMRGALDSVRERSADDYFAGMAMTPFDERIAFHITRTLTTRWPFVPEREQLDYRGRYVPTDLLDTLAFAVSRGARWELAKMQLAQEYERRKEFDAAAAEYAGLARDAPLRDEPLTLMARSLALAGRAAAADSVLRRAVAIRPTPAALALLGGNAARRHDIREAISFLEESLALDPAQPQVLYQLSLTYGVAHDVPRARAAATRLAQIAPDYPGLPLLLSTLGLSR